MAKNDITGDTIQSREMSKDAKKRFDQVFGVKCDCKNGYIPETIEGDLVWHLCPKCNGTGKVPK